MDHHQEQEDSFFNSTYADNSTHGNSTYESTQGNNTHFFEDEETKREFIKVSIYTPIIYLTILISVFVLFSTIYRRKKVSNKIKQVNSLFPRNYSKDLYLQLKLQDPKPHDKVLKAALLRRGSECIRKMFKLKESETYINVLYQKGSIGHDYYESFQLEKKLNELEMNEVAMEANSLKQNWAQAFFAVCQEITINEALRRRLNSVEERKGDLLKEWGLVGDIVENKLAVEDKKEITSEDKVGKVKSKKK